MRTAEELTKEEQKEHSNRRRKKTVSVKNLAEKIRGLRQKVTNDMKSDDEKTKLIATVVALIDCTAERVGNDSSAGDDHVGVTGFKKKHVTVSGNKVKLNYVGKSGVKHEKEFTDERIAKVLKELMKRAKDGGDFLFVTSDDLKIKAPQINKYLKDYDVTAKDIRGYAANHMVINSLKNRQKSSEESERKKTMSEVLQKVADEVGHGKGTLRKHYLLPNIEDDYVKKGKIPNIKNASMIFTAQKVEQNFYIRRIGKEVAYKQLERQAYPKMESLKNFVNNTYEDLFGEVSNLPQEVKLVVGEMPDGKIGSYRYDDGILSIGAQAFDKGSKMVCWVMLHELAHGALGKTEDSDKHGSRFQEFATALGLPRKYQD
jgi:DNA topoisomerase IB